MAERLPRCFALILLVLACLAVPAEAKRVALVIGNSAYRNAPELGNPKNDAIDMAAALKTLGFQVVEGFDLDKPGMDRKVREFSVALSGADTGVFYFAGHGLQVNGANFLVPVDAELSTAAALEFEMVRLDLVQRLMEGEAKTNILFLDACRNNPLSRNLARAMGTRAAGIGSGLAAVESGVGTLISFATQPGNVALDGTGRNSPFAAALVKHIAASTGTLTDILVDVRNDVMAATARKQVPWEHSALTGRFYFKEPSQPAAQSPAARNDAAEAWAAAKDTKNPSILEAFIKRFGDSFYADMARARLQELNSQNTAAVSPPAVKPPATKSVEPAVGVFEPERKAGETFRDCPDCPEMVVVPAGSFTMGAPEGELGADGDEVPQRKVTLLKPFAVGKYELTFAEWDACVADKGCKHKPDDASSGRGRHPVFNVSWDDVKNEYLPWLSKKTGKTYRLLTEAEWEYAARGGTSVDSQLRYAWGDEINHELANYGTQDCCAGFVEGRDQWAGTAPVGEFDANPFGLFDMHGNVWEWVEDCYKDSYEGAPSDGSAVSSPDCVAHVIRGGSWNDIPVSLRSANRDTGVPGVRDPQFGFRVARSLAP
jgi:formylglycine-generating enzyme required for sulfatase activity